MTNTNVNIVLTFGHEDQAWLRHHKIAVPAFWAGHATPPLRGDVLRIGGRQYEVLARVWEHDGDAPRLRLFLSSGHADSDTNFQSLS